MKGIRILNKNSRTRSRIIDYNFCEITNQISEEIKGLYWILSGVTFKYSDRREERFLEYTDQYEKCIINEFENIKLTRRDFVCDNAEFIKGDWDIIVGIKDAESFQKTKNLDYFSLEKYAIVLFTCIDASFWEVYSSNQKLLDKVSQSFKNIEDCVLDQKKWP